MHLCISEECIYNWGETVACQEKKVRCSMQCVFTLEAGVPPGIASRQVH